MTSAPRSFHACSASISASESKPRHAPPESGRVGAATHRPGGGGAARSSGARTHQIPLAPQSQSIRIRRGEVTPGRLRALSSLRSPDLRAYSRAPRIAASATSRNAASTAPLIGGCRTNPWGPRLLCVCDKAPISERVFSLAESPLRPSEAVPRGRRKPSLSIPITALCPTASSKTSSLARPNSKTVAPLPLLAEAVS